MTASFPDLLGGVRVIDLTTVVFGPLTTQVLADYGADVIKVEPLDGDVMRYAGLSNGDGMGPIFLNLNRGKRSIAVDLKSAEGRSILHRLLESGDVFVHNVRRAAIDRLGFSCEAVTGINPRLLYCMATGFGANGLRADAAAIDDVIQSAAGMAALNTDSSGMPRLVQSLIADKVAGLGLACAILAGLYRRSATGRGGLIDVPMYETVAGFTLLEHLQGQTFDPPSGGLGYHRILGEGRRLYRARDGFLAMTPYSAEQWSEFFRATGRPELAQDPRIVDPIQRNANVSVLYDLIEAVAGQKTVAEWEELAARIGFPAQRVNDLQAVVADQDLARTGALVQRDHPGLGATRMLASPGYFDGCPARHPGLAPRLGEHSRDILAQAGIPAETIERLRKQGVVRIAEPAP